MLPFPLRRPPRSYESSCYQYLAYDLKLQDAHLIRKFDPFVDSSDNTIATFVRNSIVTPNCNLVECTQPLEDIHVQFFFRDWWC